MASKRKKAANAAGGAFGAAKAATDNPYLRRLVEDEALRATVQDAYGASRAAYDRLANGKGSKTSRLIDDRRLHSDLRSAAESLRDAGETLRAPTRKKKRGGLLRKLVVVGVAGGIALAVSEGLRTKLLDLMFGAEEEFEYTSTTTPVPPPPAPTTPTTGGGPAGTSQ